MIKRNFSQFPKVLARNLKQFYKAGCQRLIDNKSYRGTRHKLGYPVRGQRTRTNASIQKRLHKRWITQTYNKPKKTPIKAKRKIPFIKKPKLKSATKTVQKKKQPTTPKQSKYKI